MSDKQKSNNISDEQYNYYLTEKDLYFPCDNRILKSYVSDIYDGDNFADYCKDFFELLEEEGYYD